MKKVKNNANRTGRMAVLIDGLIIAGSIVMGIVFLSLTPKTKT